MRTTAIIPTAVLLCFAAPSHAIVPSSGWNDRLALSGHPPPVNPCPALNCPDGKSIATGSAAAFHGSLTVSVFTCPNAGTDGELRLCDWQFPPVDLFNSLGGTPDVGGVWAGPSPLGGGYLGTFDPANHAPGTYTYTVTGTGPCPDPDPIASATVTVDIIPSPLGGVTGPDTVYVNDTVTYFTPPESGVSYQWNIPAGWSSSDLGRDSVRVVVGGSPHVGVSVCVSASRSTCSTMTCATVRVAGTAGIGENGTAPWLAIRPNPSLGTFQVSFTHLPDGPVELNVYDASGRLVLPAMLLRGSQPVTLNMEGKAPGTYFLRASWAGQVQVMELLLQR